ncbi:hypothetical protein D770_20500 [Flammeovirgaceae bacterium 311]|nr:hypothetical protein D770_20500 [Flammeovirgaceae bacterium 311]
MPISQIDVRLLPSRLWGNGRKRYLYFMNRIKKVFTLIHIILWTLFSLLKALQLSQDNTYWPTLTVAVILTVLYVFYSHFLLLTLYLGKKKKRAYFLRLAGITFTGPFLFMFAHYKKLDGWDPFLGYYAMALGTIVPISHAKDSRSTSTAS